jgi:YggT family protein
MRTLGSVISLVLQIFLISLFARVILDYVRMFSPGWRPKGILLALVEAVYGITDPIMNLVRRFIPPLRIGPVALDISFILVYFVTQLLMRFSHRLG